MVEMKYFKNENDAVIHVHDGKIKYEHYQDWDNFVTWDEYDKKGRLIHRKNSEGHEYFYDYTKNGYIKRFSNSNGFTSITEYSGDKVYYKNSEGYEWGGEGRKIRIYATCERKSRGKNIRRYKTIYF